MIITLLLIFVNKNINAYGSINVGEGATISGGGLTVTGATKLNSGLTVSKGLTISSNGLVIQNGAGATISGGVTINNYNQYSGLKVYGGIAIKKHSYGEVTYGGLDVEGTVNIENNQLIIGSEHLGGGIYESSIQIGGRKLKVVENEDGGSLAYGDVQIITWVPKPKTWQKKVFEL